MTRLIILLLICALATPLTACGKKGDPSVPKETKDRYPGKYPR